MRQQKNKDLLEEKAATKESDKVMKQALASPTNENIVLLLQNVLRKILIMILRFFK